MLDYWQIEGADALLALQSRRNSEVTDFSFCYECCVCGRLVGLRSNTSICVNKRIVQKTPDERDAVKNLRKHCALYHAEEYLWNVLPASGLASSESYNSEGLIKDEVLHHAFSLAAAEFNLEDLRDTPPMSFWVKLSVARCTWARCWLKLGSKVFLSKKVKDVRKRAALRHEILLQIDIIETTLVRLLETTFNSSVAGLGAGRWVNLYQLLFLERSRYRTLKKNNYFTEH